MKNYNAILKQIVFNYLSTLFIFILSPLLIFFLTRGLSIKEFGAYSLLAIAAEMIIIFLDIGLSQFIITKFPGMEKRKQVNNLFVFLMFEVLIFVFLNLILLSYGVYGSMLALFQLTVYANELVILIFIIFIGILIRLFSAYFIANKRLGFQSFIDFLGRGFWIMVLIVYLLLINKISLFEVLMFWLIGFLITLIVCIIAIRKDLNLLFKETKIKVSILKKAILFGVPLIFYHIGSYVIAMSDRFMLSYFFNNTIVGLYTLAYSLVSVIPSFGILISAIFFPYIAEAWNKKEDYNLLFNASVKYGLLITIPAMVGILVLRENLVTLISGVDYLGSAKVIPFLVLFPLFSFFLNIFYQVLLLREKTKEIAFFYTLAALINILLNVILIPRYNMIGAAIATLISYFFTSCSIVLRNKKFFKINFGFLRLERIIISSLIMGFIVHLVDPQNYFMKIGTVFLGIIIYSSLLFLFKGFVKREIEIIKRLFKKAGKGLYMDKI